VSVSENLQRRTGKDRRSRTLLSLLMGSFKRRRHGPRRLADGSIAGTDWYASPLLAAGLLILILCVVDALLTLALLGHGAYEANPLMDTVVHGDGIRFVAFKFGLTAAGVVLLILLARVKAFGRLPVSTLLYGVLVAYVFLIGYEYSLLRQVVPEYF
jgi:hypothetical protein